jgi:hypothetical protein
LRGTNEISRNHELREFNELIEGSNEISKNHELLEFNEIIEENSN